MKFYEGTSPIARRSEIRRMRAEVDALAAKPAPVETHSCVVMDGETVMRMKMRPLRIGEKRRKGDLWLDMSWLIPLVLPWWRRYGVITDKHVTHFRILP